VKAMSHPHKLFAALLIAGVLLLPAGFLSDSGRAFVLDPQIAVDPDIGRPGSGVQVSGIGFPPFSSVIIGFSENGMEQVVGFTSTGADGSFTATVAVPGDAAPGQAFFFAENSGGRAEADFFVDGSEPIGDGPGGPPANRVPVCEVVIILEKVTNRLEAPLGTDRDRLRISTRSATPRILGEGVSDKTVEDVFVRGAETNVAAIVGRFTRPKRSFPTEVYVGPLVERIADPRSFVNPGGASFPERKVKCPGSVRIETTVEIYTLRRDLLGHVDLVYRVIVREVQAQ